MPHELRYSDLEDLAGHIKFVQDTAEKFARVGEMTRRTPAPFTQPNLCAALLALNDKEPKPYVQMDFNSDKHASNIQTGQLHVNPFGIQMGNGTSALYQQEELQKQLRAIQALPAEQRPSRLAFPLGVTGGVDHVVTAVLDFDKNGNVNLHISDPLGGHGGYKKDKDAMIKIVNDVFGRDKVKFTHSNHQLEKNQMNCCAVHAYAFLEFLMSDKAKNIPNNQLSEAYKDHIQYHIPEPKHGPGSDAEEAFVKDQFAKIRDNLSNMLQKNSATVATPDQADNQLEGNRDLNQLVSEQKDLNLQLLEQIKGEHYGAAQKLVQQGASMTATIEVNGKKHKILDLAEAHFKENQSNLNIAIRMAPYVMLEANRRQALNDMLSKAIEEENLDKIRLAVLQGSDVTNEVIPNIQKAEKSREIATVIQWAMAARGDAPTTPAQLDATSKDTPTRPRASSDPGMLSQFRAEQQNGAFESKVRAINNKVNTSQNWQASRSSNTMTYENKNKSKKFTVEPLGESGFRLKAKTDSSHKRVAKMAKQIVEDDPNIILTFNPKSQDGPAILMKYAEAGLDLSAEKFRVKQPDGSYLSAENYMQQKAPERVQEFKDALEHKTPKPKAAAN